MGGELTPAREGFDFLAGADPYSDGVVARPGHEIVHVILSSRPPWQKGFEDISRFLERRERPIEALCGVELRSPRPVGFDGFSELNTEYHDRLDSLGLLVGGRNPVARTNVAPTAAAPTEVVMHGFSFTIESPGPGPSFVTAGAGELRDDALSDDAIVAPGDTSPEGLREKAEHVLATMTSRLGRLGVGWGDATATSVYTAEDPGVFTDLIHRVIGAAARHGIRWYPSRPPVSGLDFEMDVRGVRRELILDDGDA